MPKRFITAIAIVIVFLATPFTALAQNYSFSLDREEVHVFLNEDSSISLHYTFVFTNDSGAHAIDFVDVGMPNYSFTSISADVDSTPVEFSIADYQGSGSGVAVALGSESIQPGETGTVHVKVDGITEVLNPDPTDKNYASFDFSPTWFGSDFVHGDTDLTVAFHLPPGVQPSEPRFHIPNASWTGESEPAIETDEQGRVIYTWHAEDANGYTSYVFGASFPISSVPAYATQLAQPTLPPPTQPVQSTASPAATDMENNACTFVVFAIFLLVIIGYFAKLYSENRNERLEYARPQISIEGYGIKRGLTAVEAAVLLDEPLDKVLTMILFGVVKKGAATVTTRDPLQLDIAASLPEDLYAYEKNFLNAFRIEDAKQREEKLQMMFIDLIKAVGEKLRGFDSDETKRFYRGLMQRAWQQVKEAGTPEVKNREFDQSFDWLMLDRRFGENVQELFADSAMQTPNWWDAYDRGFNLTNARPSTGSSHSASKIDLGGSSFQPRSGSTPAARPEPRPSAKPVKPAASALPGADHAASIVNSVQDFSSRAVRDIGNFTEKVHQASSLQPIFSRWEEQASRRKSDESFYNEKSSSQKSSDGFLDWLLSSGSSSSSSSSSGSHRSSSSSHRSHCACACAGCACACAGGGR